MADFTDRRVEGAISPADGVGNGLDNNNNNTRGENCKKATSIGSASSSDSPSSSASMSSSSSPSSVTKNNNIVTVTFVRHGETDYNRAGRLQGHLDIALNDRGVAQAEKVARALEARHQHFDAVLSSSLMRAKQTAEKILEFHPNIVPLISLNELREHHVGTLQGKLVRDKEPKKVRKAMMREWKCENKFAGFPKDNEGNGESPHDVIARALPALENELALHEGWNSVLVATHGGLIKHIMWELLGSYQRLEDEMKKAHGVRNCCLSTLQYNRKLKSWSIKALFEDIVESPASQY